jgi:hypothetical protein
MRHPRTGASGTAGAVTPANEQQHHLEEVHYRVLALYTEHTKAIHEAGVASVSVWADWYNVYVKSNHYRNDQFIAACESTIEFLEEDYMKRKLDFIAEVYALSEKRDAPRAKRYWMIWRRYGRERRMISYQH